MNPILNQKITTALQEIHRSGILDYRSEALPTWCPGCGYYGLSQALVGALHDLSVRRKDLVVVSGIGCSGRFPFFMNSYGFHSLHGRTLPVACGIRMASPKLKVIAIGGDGDGLAIGMGHLPHAIRRNVSVTYLLCNNGVYGLTKGQVAPTTALGQVTGTTPYGNLEPPMNPSLMALLFGTSFLAQGYAGSPETLLPVLEEALSHRGFSFVHILSPCVTFDKEHLTYSRLKTNWSPLPASHDPRDFQAAMKLAQQKRFYVGVLFKSRRPTWEEMQGQIAKRAKKKGG